MRVWIGALLSLTSAAAYAGIAPTPVPEPGTLGLLAAAAVAGIVVRYKRKK